VNDLICFIKQNYKENNRLKATWISTKDIVGYITPRFCYRIYDFFYYDLFYAWQRVTIGYDNRAFHSLDYYVSNISLPVVKKVKDDYVSFNTDDKDHKQLIKDLEYIIEVWEGEHRTDIERDFKAMIAHNKRLEKANRLFGKHLSKLWS